PEQSLADVRLEPGDAAVVEVDDAFFYENSRETDFILTKRLEGFGVHRVDRAVVATAITVGMIVVAALGLTSMLNAALIATLAMLATGCLNTQRAWRSIEWSTIVVLAGAVGLEAAVTESGLSKAAAHGLAAIGAASPMIALAAVYVGTLILTNIVSNVAAAVLMFSIALSLTADLGVSILPFAMAIMSGAACPFISAASFQTHLIVNEP